MAYLTDAQHDIVSEAVTRAELETSGEIVTVVADRSDGYTDVALWWAVLASFTAMSVFAFSPDFWLGLLDTLMGGWAAAWTMGEVLTATLLIGTSKFLVTLLIQQWQPLKFLLVPARVKHNRVRDAAIRHFKVGAERRTHGRTGVLIYLSLREHRAEIVADEPIAAKVPAEVWGEAMADMLAQIRVGCVAEGLAAGVADVGKVLSHEFPRALDDINEMPNRLIEV